MSERESVAVNEPRALPVAAAPPAVLVRCHAPTLARSHVLAAAISGLLIAACFLRFQLWPLAWVTGVYSAVLIACTVAMTPGLGASAAATLGCSAVWLGGLPPAALSAMLAPWPLARQAAVWAWYLLPLPWRALRWLAGGPAADPLLLMAWLALGVTLTGWRLSVPSWERVRGGNVT